MNWNFAKFATMANNVLTTPQSRTPVQLLGKTVFKDGDREVVALQQNPKVNSRWGQLAREGHAVVQFLDGNKTGAPYIAVAVDGVVTPFNK